MSSHSLSHVPEAALPSAYGAARKAGSPVALHGFAKLVLILGALVIFTPMWVHIASQLASGQSWYALRLFALAGTAGVVTLVVLGFKVAAALLNDAGRTR